MSNEFAVCYKRIHCIQIVIVFASSLVYTSFDTQAYVLKTHESKSKGTLPVLPLDYEQSSRNRPCASKSLAPYSRARLSLTIKELYVETDTSQESVQYHLQ